MSIVQHFIANVKFSLWLAAVDSQQDADGADDDAWKINSLHKQAAPSATWRAAAAAKDAVSF